MTAEPGAGPGADHLPRQDGGQPQMGLLDAGGRPGPASEDACPASPIGALVAGAVDSASGPVSAAGVAAELGYCQCALAAAEIASTAEDVLRARGWTQAVPGVDCWTSPPDRAPSCTEETTHDR